MSTDPITTITKIKKAKKTKKTKTITRTSATSSAGHSPANATFVPGKPKILEANFQDEPTGLGYLALQESNLTFYTAYYDWNTADVITVFWNDNYIDEFLALKSGHDAIPRLIPVKEFTFPYDPGYYKLQYSVVPTPNPSKKKSTKKQDPIYSAEAEIFVKTAIPGAPVNPGADQNDLTIENKKLKEPTFTPNPVLEGTRDLRCTIPKWPNQSAYDTLFIEIGDYTHSVPITDEHNDVAFSINDILTKIPAGRDTVRYYIRDKARNFSFRSKHFTLDVDSDTNAPPRPDLRIDGALVDTIALIHIPEGSTLTVEVNHFDGLESGQSVTVEMYAWKSDGTKIEYKSNPQTVSDPRTGLKFEIPLNTIEGFLGTTANCVYLINNEKLSRIKVTQVIYGLWKAPSLPQADGNNLDYMGRIWIDNNLVVEIPDNHRLKDTDQVSITVSAPVLGEYTIPTQPIGSKRPIQFDLPRILAASTKDPYEITVKYAINSTLPSDEGTYTVTALASDRPALERAEMIVDEGVEYVRTKLLNEATFPFIRSYLYSSDSQLAGIIVPTGEHELRTAILKEWRDIFKGKTVLLSISSKNTSNTESDSPPCKVTF